MALRRSIASRLATLYALMLSVIVLFVIVASSVVLVFKLGNLTGDIMTSKHDEARILWEEYRAAGLSLRQAAPKLVDQLSGIGLRVAVFDSSRRFLAGDRELRPRGLDEVVTHSLLPKGANLKKIVIYRPPFEFISPGTPGRGGVKQNTSAGYTLIGPMQRGTFAPPQHRSENTASRIALHEILARPTGPHSEPTGLAVINGGFVAFAPSWALIWIALVPYWKFIISLAVIAIVLAWFLGLQFSKQALRPLNDVSNALRALAQGEYAQQRFVLAGGDEMASLTSAYNAAAANVAASMDERRRTEERMRQFVADAGHELRTPLTVIAGYIDVLRRGAVEEPTVAKQILATMALEKEHMRGLIDRLMQLARLDTESPPNVGPIDVRELLQSQCEAARRLEPSLEIDYAVDTDAQVLGDRTELGEALWNVVENAMKYAPKAAIHLRAARANGRVTIRIEDEGPGMTEIERLHAFERFYRGDRRGEIAGSGLGLAIAKRAVERAGGAIAIESHAGRGTAVTLTF